jgi:hypothetical protein
MNQPPNPCFCCDEPINPIGKRFVATFYGQQREVCDDCAEGIHDGAEVLERNGVKGEHASQSRP